jgi:glucans biosynthesis protein C
VTLWVASCCASCFGLLALFRALLGRRRPWMDSLARGAYLMYAIHCVYVTWIQYLLLGLAATAAVKFLVTCVTVIAASWLSAWLLLKIPRLKAIL